MVMKESVQPVIFYFPPKQNTPHHTLDPSHNLFCNFQMVVIPDECRNVGTVFIL